MLQLLKVQSVKKKESRKFHKVNSDNLFQFFYFIFFFYWKFKRKTNSAIQLGFMISFLIMVWKKIFQA